MIGVIFRRENCIGFYGNSTVERSVQRSMDEVKIVSKFMTVLISKAVRMAIRKKIGYDIQLNLNEIRLTVIEGKVHVHLDADADLDHDELMKILGNIGL